MSFIPKEQVINSILTKIQNNLLSCAEEEAIISENLKDFIIDDIFLSLPIATIYRILSKYYKISNSPNNQIVEFIIKCIDKYQNDASIFLPFLDNEVLDISHCIKLSNYSHITDSKYLINKLIQINLEQTKQMQNQINDLQDQLKTEKLFRLCTFFPNTIENIHKIIPIGLNWTKINITEGELTFQDKKYFVKASSTWNNHDTHHPIHLFNGKTSPENGLQWAPHKNFLGKPSFIQITFSFPVVANVLFITSRRQNESPSSFEIFGSNDNENFVSLKKFYEFKWENNEKKKFIFFNATKFTSYKIIVYKTIDINVVFAEINLGEVLI